MTKTYTKEEIKEWAYLHEASPEEWIEEDYPELQAERDEEILWNTDL